MPQKKGEMKTWEIPNIIIGICEDCAFYNECPAEYMCPCAELVADAIIDWNKKQEGRE